MTVMVDGTAVERALRAADASPAGTHRYALVEADGLPVLRDGKACAYGTVQGARVGRWRWGGGIWDRSEGRWVP